MTIVTTDKAPKQVAVNDIGSAEDFLAAVEKTLAEHSQLTAKLAAQLKAGDQKLLEVKGKREALKARARAAKQAANPEGTAFDRFSTLVSQIESQEEQAQAMAELLPELHPAVQDDKDRQTSERFDRLLGTGGAAGTGPAHLRSEKDQELDARLAALKAKLDKRPSGE